jgi:hypothetical protein
VTKKKRTRKPPSTAPTFNESALRACTPAWLWHDEPFDMGAVVTGLVSRLGGDGARMQACFDDPTHGVDIAVACAADLYARGRHLSGRHDKNFA